MIIETISNFSLPSDLSPLSQFDEWAKDRRNIHRGRE